MLANLWGLRTVLGTDDQRESGLTLIVLSQNSSTRQLRAQP
jgi:hypothetical protein